MKIIQIKIDIHTHNAKYTYDSLKTYFVWYQRCHWAQMVFFSTRNLIVFMNIELLDKRYCHPYTDSLQKYY